MTTISCATAAAAAISAKRPSCGCSPTATASATTSTASAGPMTAARMARAAGRSLLWLTGPPSRHRRGCGRARQTRIADDDGHAPSGSQESQITSRPADSPPSGGRPSSQLALDQEALDHDALDHDALDHDALDQEALDQDALDQDALPCAATTQACGSNTQVDGSRGSTCW